MSSHKRAHDCKEEKDNFPGSSTPPKKVRLNKEISLQVSEMSKFLFDHSIFIA